MIEVPVKMYVANLLKQAREVVRAFALVDGLRKDLVLTTLADRLETERDEFLAANKEDVLAVGKLLEGEKDKDRVKAAVDRVRLSEEDIHEAVARLRRLEAQPNPVGELIEQHERPNGMQVGQMRVPLGAIGVLSELNPIRSLEILTLCFKAGNVVVFRGIPDWTHTYRILTDMIREALAKGDVPAPAITIMERPEKDGAIEIMRATRSQLDALIVRGGAGLRKTVIETAKIPILCHDGGICHGYIDADADVAMAQNLIVNGKVQRPSEANALDTVLVHDGIARQFLPALVRRLLDEFKINVLGCHKTVAMIGPHALSGYRNLTPVQEEDWSKQFVGPTLAVKMVKDMDEALAHIAQYGLGHTAFIATRDYARARRFVREVDASAVLVNASPRLHSGEDFGLEGEVGISSTRLHARGPLGVNALTCLKYVVLGSGQLKEPHPVPVAYEDAIMLKRY